LLIGIQFFAIALLVAHMINDNSPSSSTGNIIFQRDEKLFISDGGPVIFGRAAQDFFHKIARDTHSQFGFFHRNEAVGTVAFPKGHTCPDRRCWVGTMQATEETAPPLLEYMCKNRFSGFNALEPRQ